MPLPPARLLIIGGSGTVGRELRRLASQQQWLPIVGWTSRMHNQRGALVVDFKDRARAAAKIAEFRPTHIINAALERGPRRIQNVHVAAALAEYCKNSDCMLLHISSDGVVAGRYGPHREDAIVAPFNEDMVTLAAAEYVVRAVMPTACVVRTSLILGAGTPNHEFFLNVAAGRVAASLFDDELRTPIAVEDLARCLLEFLVQPDLGLVHLGGPEAISPYEMARCIAVANGLTTKLLHPMSAREADVARPIDARLDSAFAQSRVTLSLRGARQFLQESDQRDVGASRDQLRTEGSRC